MFEELSFERFRELAQTQQRIVVYKEISSDELTPIDIYTALSATFNDVTLLEFSHSHLCFNQIASIKSIGHKITITHNDSIHKITDDPFKILREYHQKFNVRSDHPLSGFAGGMAGFISYNAIRLIEDIPNSNFTNDDTPELFFRFYEHNISFDDKNGKLVISVVATLAEDISTAYYESITKINNLIKIIRSAEIRKISATPLNLCSIDMDAVAIHPNDLHFNSLVQQAKDYIIAGDAFQIVLSREFSVKTEVRPIDIYRALQLSSPSPYMFYMEMDDFSLAGASPEKLVSLKDGIVESRPLAGTRPRTFSLSDETIAKCLLADEKECAEHMMLVDLTRNDLGSICIPGSIQVTKLLAVEKFSAVMHLSSTIQGTLQKNLDAIDAIKACFPAGTLSGAPKIRAMSIIDELEDTSRGVYGGAICAFDGMGNLESCIAIRTAMIRDGIATVRAGAGIVYDSDPQQEADETYHKARAILAGIQLAEEIRS